MPKKILIIGVTLVVIAVLVLIALGIWLGSVISGGSNKAVASPYSAVYLSNGDMYFGVLSWVPNPHLSNVWVLQKQTDQNNQQQLGIIKFDKAFWSPVDEIELNSKQIVWWSRLRNDSQLVRAINNPALVEQQQQQSTLEK